jgi:hypothetical protein
MNKKVFYRKDYLTSKKKYRLLCNNTPANLICLEKPIINRNFVKVITINEVKINKN